MSCISTISRVLAGGFLCIILAMLAGPAVVAQVHDAKGKEFWITFTENKTGFYVSDLQLHITGDESAVVRIEFMETPGAIKTFTIGSDSTLAVYLDQEFGQGSELIDPAFHGEISRKCYHVTSDRDITVYGLNRKRYSADAFLAYPDDILSNRYVVLAYPNHPGDLFQGRVYSPSEFAIVGTEDRTTITIDPTVEINERDNSAPFTIMLNRGEVFFAQGWSRPKDDVSGTEIRSNKPVAVFAGIARTIIPDTARVGADYLVEQIPPVATWGNDLLLAPFHTVLPGSPHLSSARIITALPGISWNIDGVPQGILTPGKPVEIPVTQAMRVTTSGPALAALYEHSVGVEDTVIRDGVRLVEGKEGDPFMAIVPPTEQFDSQYAFICPSDSDYISHFLTIVIPTTAAGSLRLDDLAVSAPLQAVAGTDYSYMHLTTTVGRHRIQADQPFGLYVYGYGRAISYGYPGGARFEKLVHDYQRPDTSLTLSSCTEVAGMMHDSRITDTGIDSCYATGDTSNVAVMIPPFTPGDDTIRFTARLLDPYLDGKVSVKAIDGVGRSSAISRMIPGFTVGASGMKGNSPLKFAPLDIFPDIEICRTFTLENYGNFPHSVKISVAPSQPLQVTLSENNPIILAPGEKREIKVCFAGTLDSSLTAMLTISDSCSSRTIAAFPLSQSIDTTAPGGDWRYNKCDGFAEITFNEISEKYSGISDITIDTLINATLTSSDIDQEQPARAGRVRLQRIDPRHEMIYWITARDRSGNIVHLRDTIEAFTLSILDPSDTPIALRLERHQQFDSISMLSNRCDSIRVMNYGTQHLLLLTATLSGNVSFSIPPSQFPLLLSPGEEQWISVCITGNTQGELIDTLTIKGICDITESLVLKTDVGYLLGSGTDSCGNEIVISRNGAAKRTFLSSPLPNPVAGAVAYVDIGIMREENVSLGIYDMYGDVIIPIIENELVSEGIHRIPLDISSIPSGEYLCRLRTAAGESHAVKLVITR